jgi:branched-chain amino acid transport system permease protein
MHEFLELSITGLSLAGIYAITASGLTLTYTTTGIFNFAQGAVGMIIAFCFWEIRFGFGWSDPIAWILCIAVLAPLIGVVLERTIMRPLEDAAEITRLVITIALMLFLVALALSIWNPDTFRLAQELFAGSAFTVDSIRITYNEAIILALAVVVAVALWLFLNRTRVGVTMRATVDNRHLVSLSGAEPVRSSQIAWIASMMLAGLGGVLIAPYVTLNPLALTLVIVNSYAAAVFGRLKSLPMTFAGAIVLGLCVSYAVGYIEPSGNQYLQGLILAVPALLLFGALLVMKSSRLRRNDPTHVRNVLKPTWFGGAAIAVACIITSAAMVAVLSPGDLFTAGQIWGLAIIALSFVPLVGYARHLSLCQLTFAGVGAVSVAHMGATIQGLLTAVVVAGLLGALVSLVTIRLSGIYIALSTAAVAVVFDNWIFPLPAFTILGHQFNLFDSGSITLGSVSIFGLQLGGAATILMFGAVVFGLMTMVVVAVRRSRFGERLIALSDSEQAAATLGISGRLHTVAVFAMSAAMAGVGGAVYLIGAQTLSPSAFQFSSGLPILLFVVVGGVDSLGTAAICGAFVGGPFLTDLIPNVPQITALLVAGPAIVLARKPEGLMVGARQGLSRIRDTPWLVAAAGIFAVAAWLLSIAGALTTREWLWATVGGGVVFVCIVNVARPLRSRKATIRSAEKQDPDRALGLSQPAEVLGVIDPISVREAELLDRIVGLHAESMSDA